MRIFLTLLLIAFLSNVAEAQFRRGREQQRPAEVSENTLNYANPQEYTIAGIDVSGLNVLDKNAMISLTGLKIGDKVKIPGDRISAGVRKLWKHGLVGDVSIGVDRIEGSNVYLMVILSERPRLSEFYFTGINKSRQTAIKEEIKLIRGRIVNDAMIRNTEVSVRKFFVKKGFLNTEVNIKPETDTLNRGNVKLRINVALNGKVRIHSIDFEGNNDVDETKLKKQLKKTNEYARLNIHRVLIGTLFQTTPRKAAQALTHSTPTSWRQAKEFLSENVKLNVFSASKFIKADFDEDKKALIEYYNSKGYRDADILADTVVRHSDRTIDLKIKIFEGRKYYHRKIDWTGNYLHTATTLNKILDIKSGDVYNKELLDKRTNFNPKGADVSSLYMDDGYLFFDVKPVEVAIVGDSIDIEMRVFEGDQATIDRVEFTGNERTSDHVIRRELNTVPGQKFRRSDIIRTQQMLSSMGFFNPQKIGQDIIPNISAGTVNIKWNLEEQSNDQIQLSGGWGGFYGFVGTVGLAFNNFSLRNIPHFDRWRPLPVGDGQKLAINAQANGRSFQSYSMSFTEPWLGGKRPNSFTFSINKSISRLATNFYSFTPDFSNGRILKQSGITVGLGRRLTWPDNYFTLNTALSWMLYEYKNYPGLPAEGKTTNLNINTTLARNSIDNPMYPTTGSSLSLSLTMTPPYSQIGDASYLDDPATKFKFVELHKWMIDTKFYLKLIGSKKLEGGRSLVLETKAHFGIIGSYSRNFTPGPFERFLLGGDGLAGGFQSFVLGQDIIGLRGYENNRVTPPYYAGVQTGNTSNAIQGGIVYNKLGMELRYPVTTGQSATIYGFLFAEGGNNWGNFQEFNPFQIYKSAGAGVRLFMPAFGLIGLNWGYGFDTLPGAQQRSGQQFHFTIGQQLR